MTSAQTGGIPRLLFQTARSKDVPADIERNIAHLKAQNPTFSYHLYDDDEIVDFIREEYGAGVLAAYSRISPQYGAARADLFRYLLMYKRGGVYLDLKSTTVRPLEETLRPNDSFILTHWPNEPGQEFEDFGLVDVRFPELPAGEFEQWQIITVPGHPFLEAVIEAVLGHIERYTPWRYGYGAIGTYETTGPICYTRTILPLLDKHPHRLERSHDDVGLRYSIYKNPSQHTAFSKAYYRIQTKPVIRPRTKLDAALFGSYIQICRAGRKLRRTFKPTE